MTRYLRLATECRNTFHPGEVEHKGGSEGRDVWWHSQCRRSGDLAATHYHVVALGSLFPKERNKISSAFPPDALAPIYRGMQITPLPSSARRNLRDMFAL